MIYHKYFQDQQNLILLLDEFTSALDKETEDLIITTINKLSKNLAIVGVSHRPAYNFIANKKLVTVGKVQIARYNPPWTLPFFRRNELMIRIN